MPVAPPTYAKNSLSPTLRPPASCPWNSAQQYLLSLHVFDMELTSESKLKNEKVNAGITLTSQIHKFQDFGSANANLKHVSYVWNAFSQIILKSH